MTGIGFHQRQPRTGDVYLLDFQGDGSVQTGLRPGVVFQNNTGNAHSPNLVVLPLSTSLKKLDMPTLQIVTATGQQGHNSGPARDTIAGQKLS